MRNTIKPQRHRVHREKTEINSFVFPLCALCVSVAVFLFSQEARAAEELFPKYINAQTQKSIKLGLDFLAKQQAPEGNFPSTNDGAEYANTMASLAGMAFLANGNTPSRGPYADNVRRVESFVMGNANPNGLICTPNEFNGKSMYGHGFGLLFLASVYGMETDEKVRTRLNKIINNGIDLTCKAQCNGGWTYVPGGGDEGSVTITQMQALRAAQNAGFLVPKGTVEAATKYLEQCQNPDGGIVYSLGNGGPSRLAISAAAIACLYNAGDYDSKMSGACLAFVDKQFQINQNQWSKGGGHDYYTHLYASQAFYQAGDKYWSNYFPAARDQLVRQQSREGSWPGDYVGPVYGTSIALIILQLPYKFLPIYQR
jgi:prenyltransferase beta subunit